MSTQFTHKTTLTRGRVLTACAALALLSACGDEAADASADAISITGSSTVYPFAQKVGEDFVAGSEGAVAPVITQTGTSEGIEQFCAAEGPETPDIVNASRRMTVAEFDQCTANGVTELVEIKVGLDGVAFVSSLDEGIELNLSPEIVYKALAATPFGEEQTTENWSDVDGSLAAAPIIVYGPPGSSGTRDALLDIIMMPACESNTAMAALKESDEAEFMKVCHTLRSSPTYLDQGEEDDLVVRKVANNPRAVGVFGYSYLEENQDTLKGLPLGGVMPTAETIADGTYPAARPLYIYVKKAHIGVTPGLEDYLAQWAKSWGSDGVLAKIGLVPSSEETQAASAEAATKLTVLTKEALESMDY